MLFCSSSVSQTEWFGLFRRKRLIITSSFSSSSLSLDYDERQHDKEIIKRESYGFKMFGHGGVNSSSHQHQLEVTWQETEDLPMFFAQEETNLDELFDIFICPSRALLLLLLPRRRRFACYGPGNRSLDYIATANTCNRPPPPPLSINKLIHWPNREETERLLLRHHSIGHLNSSTLRFFIIIQRFVQFQIYFILPPDELFNGDSSPQKLLLCAIIIASRWRRRPRQFQWGFMIEGGGCLSSSIDRF